LNKLLPIFTLALLASASGMLSGSVDVDKPLDGPARQFREWLAHALHNSFKPARPQIVAEVPEKSPQDSPELQPLPISPKAFWLEKPVDLIPLNREGTPVDTTPLQQELNQSFQPEPLAKPADNLIPAGRHQRLPSQADAPLAPAIEVQLKAPAPVVEVTPVQPENLVPVEGAPRPVAEAAPVIAHAKAAALPVPREPAPAVYGSIAPAPVYEPLYSFRAENLDIKQALALFGRANNLNIVPDLEVTGLVTVDLQGLPLSGIMDALLDVHGFFWEEKNGLIRVHTMETRIFTIDYPRLIRSGDGYSSATLSGASAGGEE